MLKTIFVERKGVVGIDSDEEIKNIHDAYVNEHLTKFDAAMKQDHLYQNATAFMNQGMIWLMKVLKKYMATQVLHFSH